MATSGVVYVASGHSSSDPGAMGNGLRERDLNLAICKRLVQRLRDHGITVKTDLERGNLPASGEVPDSRRYNTVLFYSQHHNGFGKSSARGYEIFKTGTGRSYRFAKALAARQLALLRKWDSTIPHRGIKEANNTRAEYLVMQSKGAAALAENLFVTNPKDAAIAKRSNYASAFAEATCRAIVEFGTAEKLWKKTYKPPAVPAPPKPEPPKPPTGTLFAVAGKDGKVVGRFANAGNATAGASKIAQDLVKKTGKATITKVSS